MIKKYIAEFIATFALVFCGTGAVTINEITNGSISHIGVAICFGLIVMIMIHVMGDISGAHMNPAVTLVFAFNKNFPWMQVPGYFVSQLAGGFAASFLLQYLFPSSYFLGATIPSGPVIQSFVLEIVLAFFLMLVILRVATGSKEQGLMAGITIGSVVLLEAMFAGPISGASMNPVRSLAPAFISGQLQHIWIYLTAPFVGMLMAIPFHHLLKK
ncbi:MAG: aquaporin [Ferruginibacter sp.]